MYNKLETRYVQCENLPDSDVVYTKYRNIGPSEFLEFGRDTKYRKNRSKRIPDSAAKCTKCRCTRNRVGASYLIYNADAVFTLSFCVCSKSSVRVAYHAAARRHADARCDRASRLTEMDTARAAHALLKIFNCACGIGSFAFSVQPMQWPGISLEGGVLSAGIEYLVQIRADMDSPRAEYARRRSSTLDPGILAAVS